jgi:ABC-type uncharacterized transport system substrate-binding protein
VCSWPPGPRTIRKDRPFSTCSCRSCTNWAGPTQGRRRRWQLIDGATPAGKPHRTHRVCCGPRSSEAGFVNSLARPGTNATGLVLFEYSLSAKWLELLKQIAPSVRRVAVMRDPAIAAGIGQYGAIQSVAPSFAVELTPVNVQDTGDMERAVREFASVSNGGLIVTASAPAVVHRKTNHCTGSSTQAARSLF